MTADPPAFYDTKQVMQILQCSRDTVKRRRAELGGRRIGRLLRFPREAILLAGTPVAAPVAADPEPTPTRRTAPTLNLGPVSLLTGKPFRKASTQ